jgi:glycine betaine/proline transport system permease protein
VVFYLLLPLKIGLREAATPATLGFTMNSLATLVYLITGSLIVLIARTMIGWTAAIASAIALLIYFFGLLGLPWLAMVAIICTASLMTGGWYLCLFSFFGLLFIALNGAWDQAMISLELTAAGVTIAFILGSAIGVWAALNDRVSAVLRPISDTLQTMPSFVFLIPAIMIFLVGEFTALVAIVLYAIVPSIRYAEHGIRNVPSHVVEAAVAFGSSGSQVFWHVRLPLALPELMLGLNQTIMMALAMVVVAALVGAQGLGQDIMIALTWMDVGKGIVFGLSIAILAIIADRITQSWIAKRKLALSLR